MHATFAREFEYERHGTASLLAGIDPVSGKIHALVRDRHRSREFIEFLKLLDAAYPAHTAIKFISKETRAWIAQQPAHRFEFTFHARLLAQPHRGFLFQAHPLCAAPHPRRIQTRTQGSHHGRNGLLQSRPRRSHLDPQARQAGLI
jgi:hypothetical protein